MTRKATYVFCVVSTAKLRLRDVPPGLPAMGSVRALEMGRGLHAIVADVPLSKYNEAALNRGLSDLERVSRAAVAHEAVIEHFIDATALLPMKLYTIFDCDERALAHLRAERSRIDAAVKRVSKHQEWGVRVLLDRGRAIAVRYPVKPRRSAGGMAYLAAKKARREVALELASSARQTVTALYDELAGKARLARRRSAGEPPLQGGSLLLDAAFLIPRARAASFRGLAARRALALAPRGYAVTLSGPWPPYTFVQD